MGHSHHHRHPHPHHEAHDHHAHHVPVPNTLNRAFIIGILLNVGFVGVEAFYGWQAQSLALMADAGHNLSDVAGLILAWGAMLAAQMKPTHDKTYGWQRTTILAAFINAVVLVMAMAILMWNALDRFQHPLPLHSETMMWVAGVGIVINAATALLFMKNAQQDLNIRGAFLHMAADAAISAGVVLAGAVYQWTAWNWLDPVLTCVIAMIVVIGTWHPLKQSLHLLVDGVPQHIHAEGVRLWLMELEGVEEVHDLHIWAMSTTEVALSAHLVMPNGHPGDAFLKNIEESLQVHFQIVHPTIQIELEKSLFKCLHP